MSGGGSVVLGVALGSTRSCVAVYKDGTPLVVANDAGDRVTPCATTLSGKENALRVATRQELGRQTANLIHGPLCLLGRSYEEVSSSACLNRQQCEVADLNGKPVFRLATEKGSSSFTPGDAVAAILHKLKESAKSAAGKDDAKDCVVAVPVSFLSEQRLALKLAAEKAGLNVLRIISEPASALLAYSIGQKSSPNVGNVLVFDMGGTSVNTSIVSVVGGLYRIVASYSNDNLGGVSFDKAITRHFAAEFQRKWRMDMTENKRSMAKLCAASELCRQSLSSLSTAPAMVESLYDGYDFQGNLGRARFEGLCGPLLQSCMEPVSEVLKSSGLPPAAISKVVLTGGCSRTPKLRQLLETFFSGNAEILASISPEEVIATGACLQANLIASGVDRDVENPAESQSEIQCLSRGLCVALSSADGTVTSMQAVFPVSTPVPVRNKLSLDVPASQACVVVTVCEHDAAHTPDDDSQVKPLAHIVLKELPVSEDVKHVDITMAIDRCGSLLVTAKEVSSQISGTVTVEGADEVITNGHIAVSNGEEE